MGIDGTVREFHQWVKIIGANPNGTLRVYGKDDGSGRQGWRIKDIGNGKYNIMIAGGTERGKTFLSCRPDGYVDLYEKDDGSGRQQWLIKEKTDYAPYNKPPYVKG